MIDFPYSLVIEATDDPTFFGFYCPELEGLSGAGHSIENCLHQARREMEVHVASLRERGLPVPPRNPNPVILIQNAKTDDRSD